jgi:hypothetical protein
MSFLFEHKGAGFQEAIDRKDKESPAPLQFLKFSLKKTPKMYFLQYETIFANNRIYFPTSLRVKRFVKAFQRRQKYDFFS